ncbi:MAG TPA: calcium-translocating P-type ATPase, SERCA-type [Clostridia bacterium]|nr:calcium-translocating P-type ATPase, SERCA-type [Clostridia bacterium]
MSRQDATQKNPDNEHEIHKGLSEKEARKKLLEHGPNLLAEKKKISPVKLLLSQFTDVMVIILMVSTAISAFMGDITEAVTIIAIVILNAVLGFVQEFRTEKTMEALKSLAAPVAKVLRSGRQVSIPAEQIVPGDLVLLETGDRIPADAVLLESVNLQVDESLLTGESVPVEKYPAAHGAARDRRDRKNMVFMGTSITGGRAKASVTATGMNTEMGGIADLIQNIEEDDTPLQKKLAKLGKIIAAGCLIICAIVAASGILRGEEVFSMLLSGISLAVAAVPEGLPAIVTISLALGVQRMLKRNALIRKLPAVETLGCAGVVCSDKTGTLTQNKMTVRKIMTTERQYSIKENKDDRKAFYSGNSNIDPLGDQILRLSLEIAGLCNNAELKKATVGDSRWEFEGDPTEGALLVASARAGLTPEKLTAFYTRMDEIPFDSDRKCMSVVCRNHKGETYVFTKGAPDILLKSCKKVQMSNGVTLLTPEIRAKIYRANDSMAGEALRVIAVAYKKLDPGYRKETLEAELIFTGLIGMLDPPRPEAAEAVLKCRLAGIKPVMITGDHKLTAVSIAKELDIFQEGEKVLTGAELDTMDERSLEKVAGDVSVYARVSPKHKLMIVRALKKLGNIVAMTGDGVNDAPAIKEADIGVSMGQTGTDVTKEASAMVLLDDNFATIIAAIEEGRVIYNNIRKFIRYMLACNIGEVLNMFIGMLAGLPVPLLPIQILWVNLVTDGLPAVALGFDPPEKDVMKRPPRGPDESIFSHGLSAIILTRGVLIGLTTLAVFVTMIHFTADVGLARTGAFVTLMLIQLIHVFECKSETRTIFQIPLLNNLYLVFAVLISLAMVLAVVYIPSLQGIFKTVPLSLNDWFIVGGMSFLVPVAASFFPIRRR